MELLLSLINKIIATLYNLWDKFNESVFVTKKQYRLRLIDCYTASNKLLVIRAIKRVKSQLSTNVNFNKISCKIHPVVHAKLHLLPILPTISFVTDSGPSNRYNFRAQINETHIKNCDVICI